MSNTLAVTAVDESSKSVNHSRISMSDIYSCTHISLPQWMHNQGSLPPGLVSLAATCSPLSTCESCQFFFFFFFFCIPSYVSGVHHSGEGGGGGGDFLRMWSLHNPTKEAATFRLRGRCMLGVFLLLAFTHLRHECQDLLSLCHGMHVCTD